MKQFNQYGFIPDSEKIYELIKKYSNYAFKKSEIKEIFKLIDSFYPISTEDMVKLYFFPIEHKKEIFERAIKLNEILYKKEMNFYGVVYINDFCIETCNYCGDNIFSIRDKKIFLSKKQLADDIKELLKKESSLPEICILTGDTPSLTIERWIDYLKEVFTLFNGKIILNIQPQDIHFFRKIKEVFPDKKLQFRVFQETYDFSVYKNEHPHFNSSQSNKEVNAVQLKMNILYPPKMNFSQRINSQERAILAGFDEFGFGVLFGLNENLYGGLYEIIALYEHSYYMYNKYGQWPATVSFPRILPSNGVDYDVPGAISDDEFIQLISIFRLAIPYTKLIITARETGEFRKIIRPVINIEDYEARPGPGGNSTNGVVFQMEITDRRSGSEIKKEIINQGFTI